MWNVIILIISLIIGIIHGVFIASSFNILISWIMIGIWIIFTLKFFKKIKQHREYHSPHNTAFFILLPLFIGILFTVWSNYTGLLGVNLLGASNVSLNLWSILFGFPYLLYSLFSLYYMFRKYISVYFGTKSVGARAFGFFIGFSTIFVIVGYWIYFFNYFTQVQTLLNPINYSFDLILIISLVIIVLLMIYPGIFGKRSSLPQITEDYITARTRNINENVRPQNRPVTRRQQYNTVPTPRTRSSTSRSQSTTTRRTSRPTTASNRSKQTKAKPSRVKATPRTQKNKPQTNYAKLKPKGVNLTKEDFKCIFCFELPKYPEDNGRGIIICPECRYPAHADEFKDWTKNSSLCSRCDAPLPIRYIRNPKIIPIKEYMKVIKMFSK
ncbi:MAG: hypothetical protein ACFFBP_18925 [Promethearchaeota archaeon]